jgi:hypothetical protein
VTVSRPTVVAVSALAFAFGAVGCSGGGDDKSAKAARAAAQEAFDRYSSGDYAGAWETYTDEGHATISKADFVSFNDQCPPKIRDKKVSVVSARLENSTTAVVRLRAGDSLTAYTFRYQHGHWRVQPSADATAMWKLGVTKAVEKAKASGLC